MLERTVSFWKRILHGRADEAGTPPAAGQERRVWIRFPADLPAQYQPAGAAGTTRLPARIRDISLGGVSLVVDRTFQPGDLLSVELPGAAGVSTTRVLACVVHARPADARTWAVGCTFARELSADDLQTFGAERRRTEAPDQRTWMRFAGSVTATWQPVAEPGAGPRPAEVFNISAGGVGLLVTEPVENGVLLTVALRAAAGGARRDMLACVVHVTSRAEGGWALGCNFIRSLSEEDLEAFL